MTRKTLSLLVITPVLFFALDKTISPAEGGGKDKDKKVRKVAEVTTQGKAQEKIQAEQAELSAAMNHKQKVEMVASLMEQMNAIDARTTYYDTPSLWQGHENLTEGQNKAMKKIRERLNEANVESITLRSFSRCPSGYDVMMVCDDNQNYQGYGYLVFENGCDARPLAVFTMSGGYESLKVKIADETFVTLDEFIELYKEAKS